MLDFLDEACFQRNRYALRQAGVILARISTPRFSTSQLAFASSWCVQSRSGDLALQNLGGKGVPTTRQNEIFSLMSAHSQTAVVLRLSKLLGPSQSVRKLCFSTMSMDKAKGE